MTNRSQVDILSPVNAFDPAVLIINNTTVAGATIDLQGFDSATIIAAIGAWGDTVAGGLMELGLQHCDTTVTGEFVDVPNEQLTDTVAAASTVTGAVATGVYGNVSSTSTDQKTVKTGYIGGKRYIRSKINGEKNLATGTPVAVIVLKGIPANAPV